MDSTLGAHLLHAHRESGAHRPSRQVGLRLEELQDLPLFYGIAPEALLPLARTSELVTFGDGEVIVHQGDPGDSIYVIVSGRVDVLARVARGAVATESVVASLVAGDSVGELSLLDGQPRSATCVAAVETRCVRLEKEAFWTSMRRHWPLAQALFATLARRIRSADASLADLARDPLTAVYNRRALFEIYDRESRRAQRSALHALGIPHEQVGATIEALTRRQRGEPVDTLPPALEAALLQGEPNPNLPSGPPALAVLFVDVDSFKTINDTFGHQTGDQVLCAVGHTLTSCGRALDSVARHGGDEFAMVLPEAGAGGAELMMQRVRRRLTEEPPGPVPFWLSMGAAVIDPIAPLPIEQLLAQADAAMYQDKQRNRRAHLPAAIGAVRSEAPTSGA